MNATELRNAWAIGLRPTAAHADLICADLSGADLTGVINYEEATK